ncbi:molybdate ABC transporter substrate-binding protein [Psychromicrobium xiongbiense]|uniref:molybdate ABC transporter substrate-binding protein n=1 Tax=Psychromicrobium xiongbiense TaxID=3051184 RepID=UPI0025556838|nr:molybdate ABC transporter substrate-binding protein [Psychromicrobium sp. YIM S02556]
MKFTRTQQQQPSRKPLGRRGVLAAALSLIAVAAVAGCSAGNAGSTQPVASSTAPQQTVIIFAAASLKGPLDDVATAFTARNPQYKVAPIVYDGSQALATQAIDGASVDVLAFASQASLDPVTKTGLTDSGKIFATNTLQIAVAPGNPRHLQTLADLAKPGVSVVLCAAEVPCGQAAQKLLKDANVAVKPVSEETNVTSVVARVSGGEADAGLVYSTDVKASGGKLEGVTPPNAKVAINKYPVAVSSKAHSPEGARAFEDFLLSDDGQKILQNAGFGAP